MTLFVSQRQPESVVSIMLYATIILFVSGAKKWENWLKFYILINYKKNPCMEISHIKTKS